MLHSSTIVSGKREIFHVAAGGVAGKPVDLQARDAIALGLAEIERAGLPLGHIIRSRLWARDAAARQAASNVRLDMLRDERRAASSSFIDPRRLPTGADMMIELYALASRPGAAAKVVHEYDPPIAPPQFVTFDGLLVLSGDTDRSQGLDAQMASIRRKLDASFAAGGGNWERAVSVSVFLARKLPEGAGRSAFAQHFAAVSCSLMFTTVDGYSHPEKLVEIEVTADLSRGM